MNNWLDFPAAAVMFPRLLRKQSYRTDLIGNWNLKVLGGNADAPAPGFDHWTAFRGLDYIDLPASLNGTPRASEIKLASMIDIWR